MHLLLQYDLLMVLFNESCLVEGCNFNFFFPDISIVESRQTLKKKKTFPVVLVYLSVQCALLCVSEDGLFLFFPCNFFGGFHKLDIVEGYQI